MNLITVEQVKTAAEAFIAQHRKYFPVAIAVEVLDMIVPGTALLLLMEKPPTGVRATMAYGIGVAFLRLAKRLDQHNA